jgi:hypothetical protein
VPLGHKLTWPLKLSFLDEKITSKSLNDWIMDTYRSEKCQMLRKARITLLLTCYYFFTHYISSILPQLPMYGYIFLLFSPISWVSTSYCIGVLYRLSILFFLLLISYFPLFFTGITLKYFNFILFGLVKCFKFIIIN